VLSPPDHLAEGEIVAALARHWGLAAATVTYRPLGFGSHHWEATDAAGTRWFATVDELAAKRRFRDEPVEAAYERLRAALGAATDLRRAGRGFVVAPLPTRDGEPLVRLAQRYALALYPYVPGRSFDWGQYGPEHGQALLDLVVGVHTAPPSARRRALADDFAVSYRDELAAALTPGAVHPDSGPYARPTADLLAAHEAAVRRFLDRYDALVATARTRAGRAVLTHGEPHPGNTILAPDGWRLIDWETALVAPPERDLWSLDPGDGSILDGYAAATGVRPLSELLELYRVRWDVAELALDVGRFRRPHAGNADDDKTWEILTTLVTALDQTAPGRT
jgi:spectinomycin phosphotransferase/16S rRNA (guanine(1405)-N(7))-methyltransferase